MCVYMHTHTDFKYVRGLESISVFLLLNPGQSLGSDYLGFVSILQNSFIGSFDKVVTSLCVSVFCKV